MFQTNKAETIKKIIVGLCNFNDELIFRINSDHLWFCTSSRDNTSLVIVKYPSTNFQKYDFDKVRDIKFDARIVKDILKKVDKDDTLYISFDSSSSNAGDTYSQIKITISSAKFKKSYDVPLLHIADEDSFRTQEPAMTHDNITKINNKEFLEMLDSLVFVERRKGGSDSIFVVGDGEKLEVKEEAPLGKSVITLKDFISNPSGIPKVKISCKFSAGLLIPLVTFQSSLAEVGEYYMKKDYPIRSVVKTDELESTFILAPRVENVD